jgi:WD40 repeat protein
VASASYDKTVRLWDTATGAARGTLEAPSSSIDAVVFSPDGQLVASAPDDNTVRLWDVTTGAACRTLKVDVELHDLSFSSCGQCLETDRGAQSGYLQIVYILYL